MPVRAKGQPTTPGEEGGETPLYSIGDLASEFSISTRAIRFYEIKGLLNPKRAGANRVYSKRDRARLILILRGKRLGFSLEGIAEYLNLYDADPHHIAQTRLLLQGVERAVTELEQKQQDIEKTLAELREIRELAIQQLKTHGRNTAE
jgi:DNA-binding transcriptional MerR regulator